MKTFTCQFGSGTSCTVQVTDDIPPQGTAHIQNVEWTGTPSPKLLRPYIGWMNSVNQQLANQWGASLMHMFMVAPAKAEVWIYKPGEKPQLVADK